MLNVPTICECVSGTERRRRMVNPRDIAGSAEEEKKKKRREEERRRKKKEVEW